MGEIGRKSIDDHVHKSSGGGRETEKIKMAGGIKSIMERRVKNWLGVWAREELFWLSLLGNWMGEGYGPRAKQGLCGHPL